MPSTQLKPHSLEQAAIQGGISIANSILARVADFPKREDFLKSWMKHELESVPSQILWQGLEDEAAPVFVVYKLLHEAFSNSPAFFRRFITDIMTAQPDRFSRVFNRETLWSMVARPPVKDLPRPRSSAEAIKILLESLNKKSFWRRSEAELTREAQVIANILSDKENPVFRDGVEALRRLQLERATGLTNGNLLLFVPAKLNQYVSEVAELGLAYNLPSILEINHKIAEIARDQHAEGRHLSIPIDVLFTEIEGAKLECFILAREKASREEQIDLRKKSLMICYFLKYAFSAYAMENLNVRFAFYLDPSTAFKPLPNEGNLFHDEEIIIFEDFWKVVAGREDGKELIFQARDAAAAKLKEDHLMAAIKSHFARDRKPETTPLQRRAQQNLFSHEPLTKI